MNEYSQQPVLPPQPPKNWLVESILTTIFCCMPFGIVGIVFAAQVNSKYNAGDYVGAQRASEDAAKWTKISFWIGISVIALYILAIVFFGATAFWASRNGDFE